MSSGELGNALWWLVLRAVGCIGTGVQLRIVWWRWHDLKWPVETVATSKGGGRKTGDVEDVAKEQREGSEWHIRILRLRRARLRAQPSSTTPVAIAAATVAELRSGKNGAEATVMDPCGGARGETWWLTGSCRGVATGSREVGAVLGATNRRRVVAGTVGEDRTMATLMGLPRLVPVR